MNSLWYDAPEPKKSYQGTRSKTRSDSDEIKVIENTSGLIKWEYNNLGFVSGSFKQIYNPTAFDIKSANVLHRGSIVSQVNSITCLALNVGKKSMADHNLNDGNQNFIEKANRTVVER